MLCRKFDLNKLIKTKIVIKGKGFFHGFTLPLPNQGAPRNFPCLPPLSGPGYYLYYNKLIAFTAVTSTSTLLMHGLLSVNVNRL